MQFKLKYVYLTCDKMVENVMPLCCQERTRKKFNIRKKHDVLNKKETDNPRT